MPKLSKETMFTELAIQIATLDMKVSKVLELLNKPDIEVISLDNQDSYEKVYNFGEVVTRFNNTPPQWPNESRTNYLKRIGQYNEAQSDDEFYGETYK